jgi:hypothetical protein
VDDSNDYAVSSVAGRLTITDSVIEDSKDGVYAGQFTNAAPKITLSGDTIKGNRYVGVYVSDGAALTLSHSLVENNNAGVLTYGGPTTVTASSIVDNGAVRNDGYGGVRSEPLYGDGPVTIVNSTISGNVKTQDQLDVSSGGIAVGPSIDLTLTGDTVTDNEADNVDSTVGATAFGGGISMGLIDPSASASKLTLEDSVVAGNKVVAADGPSAEMYPDIALAPELTSLVKDSLIGAGATAADTLTALTFSGGNQKGTTAHPLNPKLGKLGPEGSKTATAGGRLWVQEPLKRSPLIGKGAAKPFSTKAHPFTTDELGTKRPAKGVTIGAYQVPPKKKPKKRK